MKKNFKTLICAFLCVLLFLSCLTACGPTSTAKVTEIDAEAAEVFDEVLLTDGNMVYGYKKGEMSGYDLLSLDTESGKLTVHGNTSAYVVYDKSLVFGPSIVIDGMAYVTTTSSERENEDHSFAVKGVELFAFGKGDSLEYGRLFEDNVTVEKLEEKDGNLVVYIEDAEELFNVKDM